MSTPQIGIIRIISKQYHDHLLKPLYIKLQDILEDISFNISNIKPIETSITIPPWNTNHIETNTELNHFNKNDTPHSLIINRFYEIINTDFKTTTTSTQTPLKQQMKPVLLLPTGMVTVFTK